MVSFSCEVCNDTVIKKRLPQHQRSCRGSYFTCIDCSTTFYGNDHQKHTSCISEAEKYEKALYKGKKGNNRNQNQNLKQKQQQQKKEIKPASKEEPKTEPRENKFDLSKYVENKPTSLYKIFKAAKKDNKDLSDKTDFLKNVKLTQNKDGSYSLSI